jgi:hypothetical protein
VGLTSKTIRLEARCDALEIACETLARKAGIPAGQMLKTIDDMTAAFHQKRLERVENASPAIAAEIDNRPSMPDLPDELL